MFDRNGLRRCLRAAVRVLTLPAFSLVPLAFFGYFAATNVANFQMAAFVATLVGVGVRAEYRVDAPEAKVVK